MSKKKSISKSDQLSSPAGKYVRPPIVAVLGHVDHGKTTLLDTIRQTQVAQGEIGGITQHIGAYQIQVKSQKSKVKSEEGKITFIDTPGHEAFAKMRSHGVRVADLVILVVAVNDGVKPQTKESIAHIKQAKVPLVVALNKIDLPDSNIAKVKQQLAGEQIVAEDLGGDVVMIPVSAKQGKGISELLEAILLVSELNGSTRQVNLQNPIIGVVIEVKHDARKGILASVIVKDGLMKQGQTIFAEQAEAKIRLMTDDRGRQLRQALPSMPVEIMGWKQMPTVGALVLGHQPTKELLIPLSAKSKEFSLPSLGAPKKLKIVLKADVAGTLTAIKDNLGEKVDLVLAATGDISESDVLLAKGTGAVVVGFNVSASTKAKRLSQTERVMIKTYQLIYRLLEDIDEVIEMINNPQAQEKILGEAQILAEFTGSSGRIAGCKVISGRIARGDNIKLMRQKSLISRAKIKSIRHLKDSLDKAEQGKECGVVFDKELDFHIGDLIIPYKKNELMI